VPGQERDFRVVCGDPKSVFEVRGRKEGADMRGSLFFLDRRNWQPGLGFRCARSQRPRLEAKDFSRVVDQ
jgi:hypothetical protein